MHLKATLVRLFSVALVVPVGACIIEEAPKPAPQPEKKIEIEVTPPETTPNRGTFEKVGQRLDRGAEKLDKHLERGAERLGEAMQEAGRDLEENAEEAQRRRAREEAARQGVKVDVQVERP